MPKLFIYKIYFLNLLFGCNPINRSTVEYKVVIDTITKGGLNEWYEIHEQFINSKPCTSEVHFASVYLCSPRGSNDTVLIVSPCSQIKYKKNTVAALYTDENITLGDTARISIAPEYSIFLRKRNSVVFGILKIPSE